MKRILPLLFLIGCSTTPEKPVHAPEVVEEGEGVYKLVMLGDTGTGDENQMKVAKAACAEGVEDVEINGDLAYPDGFFSEDDPQFMDKLVNPYKCFKRKFLVKGNHGYGRLPVWKRKHLNKWHGKYGIHYPDRHWFKKLDNGTCLIAWDPTGIADGDTKFFKNLDLSVCKKHIVAFGHYPYLTDGKHKNMKGSSKKTFEKYLLGKVHVYISGHNHNSEYLGKVQGTHLVVVGNSAKTREFRKKPRIFGSDQLGYGVLSLGKKIKIELKDVNGKTIFKVED